MKSFPQTLSAIAISLLVFLTGCMKNEFNIRFEFPKDFMGNYIASYYAWSAKQGTWIENTVPVQQGKAELKCVTNRPTLVYISDASSNNSIVFFAERGDEIIISGENSDMNKWNVKGNKISEQWSDWRVKNADILSKSRDKFTKDKEKAISDFVNQHKSDELATLIMLTEWNRRDNPDGFLKLWNSIDEDAKDPQLLELCGCTDLTGVGFKVNATGNLAQTNAKKITDVVLRSRDNGTDTLRFNKVKSSLLYFFSETNSAKEEAIDSLRVVADEFPDSTKRIISVVSMHPDSMAWINSVSRDTVKGVVNSWIPRGVSDPKTIDMGVSRTPWFMVIDKDGKSTYAGDDAKDALTAFRKEMKKKEKKQKGQTPNAKR